MKEFRYYSALLMLLCLGLQFDAGATLYRSSDHNITVADETRNVKNFSGVSSSGSYNVFITMGNTESLRLEGDAEQISNIETIVENGTLKIKNKSRNWGRSYSGRVNIYINAKTLNLIQLSGSGNMQIKGAVRSENFTAAVSGSGNVSTNIEAKNFSATISGSGDMTVTGKTENAKIAVSGSGNFDGKNLATSVSSAKVSGSGNISIRADKALDAAMSGSGNIRYSGNADVRSSRSGSGRISKI